MERDIDQKNIKISGKMEISSLLEIGQELVVALKGTVIKTEVTDNQDGTVNITYILKPYIAEIDVKEL